MQRMTWFRVGWRAQQSAIIDVKCKTLWIIKILNANGEFLKGTQERKRGDKKKNSLRFLLSMTQILKSSKKCLMMFRR